MNKITVRNNARWRIENIRLKNIIWSHVYNNIVWRDNKNVPTYLVHASIFLTLADVYWFDSVCVIAILFKALQNLSVSVLLSCGVSRKNARPNWILLDLLLSCCLSSSHLVLSTSHVQQVSEMRHILIADERVPDTPPVAVNVAC